MSAIGADIASKYSTPVAIATAPSARPRPAPSGLQAKGDSPVGCYSRLAQKVANGGHQVVDCEGLGEVAIHARREAPFAIPVEGDRGKRNYRNVAGRPIHSERSDRLDDLVGVMLSGGIAAIAEGCLQRSDRSGRGKVRNCPAKCYHVLPL
jgi:hypothetical protein